MLSSVTSTRAPEPVAEAAPAGSPSFVNQDTFLRLLVAQLKNQDPLNPADGAQFVAQLAQLTQLEQTIGIKEELSAIRSVLAEPPRAGLEPPPTNS